MLDELLESIRRDIATFADPGAEIEVTPRHARWKRDRRLVSVDFIQGPHDWPDILISGERLRYVDFFASEHVADLASLAEGIINTIPRNDDYVDAPARAEDSSEDRVALDLISKLSSEGLPFGSTRVVFVRGAAGAGKTVALRQLARLQAEKLVAGRTTFLYFYVDAQARSLSRLDEAVALLLQDMGARFTYRALATLTRLQRIVPIIDGFDELLGSRGYGEAFDSLARFLTRLDGRGSIVASARATFYEYGDFQQSASRFEQSGSIDFELAPLDVLPWSITQVEEYVQKTKAANALGASSPHSAAEKLQRLLGSEGSDFLGSPFFVATIIRLLKEGADVETDRRLIPQMIEHFIDRERDKLRDTNDRPILSSEDHRQFLEMLSEEMWWQRSRDLDTETVKTIAELAADLLEVDPVNRVTVVERAPSYAFFDSREREGQHFLGFTHEFYYSYFLARFFIRALSEERELADILARSRLSPVVGREFGQSVREGGGDSKALATALSERRVPSLTRETDRENAGELISGLVRYCSHELGGSEIQRASFMSSDLRESELSDVLFRDCDFYRCDLSGVNWKNITVESCTFSEPIVNNRTNMNGLRLDIGKTLIGIAKSQGGRAVSDFNPPSVARICKEAHIETEQPSAMPELTPKAERHIKLLQKFLRAAGRHFYLSDDDLQIIGVLHDEAWPTIETLLNNHGLIDYVTIARRGTKNVVRKLQVPPSQVEEAEASAAASPELVAFWREIRDL